ncbi:DUF418 domain-containing protein [Paenibacillus shenyangensis]|uniref:DUF418 domain-containing protein n=1 Tax=Paenibacillus sp. A9 TaxID=1284352 RepID=UPI000A73B5CB|nr:DUF418 domain-containing protein [Paenibacillus sp. A9]
MYITNRRLKMIDAMRGFSLLGIILANMLIFQYGSWGAIDLKESGFSTADQIVNELLEVLVVGSFMPIFAFLFGFGIIKMKDSLESRQLSPYPYLSRRFLLLMLIGMLHGFFIWEGDILTYYGLYGFVLLLYIRCRPRTLLIWTIAGFSLMLLFGVLSLWISTPETALTEMERSYHLETLHVYSMGSYADILVQRNMTTPFLDFPLAFILIFVLVGMTSLLYIPLFWLGMYMAQKDIFNDPQSKSRLYRNGMLIFLPVGLISKSMMVIMPVLDWETFSLLFGGPILSIGYIFAFAWLYLKWQSAKWMNGFIAIGKLSLTNYLLQSIICMTIYYGYGLGLFGQLGIAWGALVAVLIYALQFVLSPLYLRKYNYGPVEKLLRMWTNWSRSGKLPAQPPVRDQAQPAVRHL